MDDTSNWEFAAAVAAVSIGLAGLLLFTLIGTLGSWRVYDRALRASNEAAKASLLVQDLAREMATREALRQPDLDLARESAQLADLRRQANSLIEQQRLLQNAVRNLIEAGVLRREGSAEELEELQRAVQRLEQHLGQVAEAVARVGRPES